MDEGKRFVKKTSTETNKSSGGYKKSGTENEESRKLRKNRQCRVLPLKVTNLFDMFLFGMCKIIENVFIGTYLESPSPSQPG